MNADYINKYCRDHLTDKRLRHTEGVIEVAVQLAERYGADVEKAKTAAVCHDLYRGCSVEEINACIQRYGLDRRYLNNPNLAHGKIAAAFMEAELGVNDRDILNAVSYHTTGRRGMSLLEKVVYMADATERGRDYPGVEELRKTAVRDLDEAMIIALGNTIKYVGSRGGVIDKDTLDAYDELRKEKNGKQKDGACCRETSERQKG